MNFDSLRHEISHLVHEPGAPYSKPQLQEMCSLADDETQLAQCIFKMCEAEELARIPAPAGSGKGVKWVYGPGKNKPGAEDSETAWGGATPKVKRAKKQRHSIAVGAKRKTTKRGKRRPKVQRRNATSRRARHGKRAPYGARKAAARSAEQLQMAPRVPRWALTADGALVDIGTPGSPEIPKPAARALVAFIRTLHQDETEA